MAGRLNGRVALVTGAGRGIGLEIARSLHSEGAAVALADVDEDAVRAAAHGLGEAALPLRCDVTRQPDVLAAVAATEAAFGGLAILVNNGGSAP